MPSKYNLAQKRKYAKKMRLNMTSAEKAFWNELKKYTGEKTYRKYNVGVKFHPQKLMLGWIIDFYSGKVCIAIEIDGEYHNTPEQVIKDSERDKVMLQRRNIITFRFKNTNNINEINNNLAIVREAVLIRRAENKQQREIKRNNHRLPISAWYPKE